MAWSRRDFLLLMGVGGGAALLEGVNPNTGKTLAAQGDRLAALSFEPVAYPLPLAINTLSPAEQKTAFATFTVQDDLVLPPGYTYQVLAQWGETVGDSWFGFNNDYLGLVETGTDQGYLTVNFEYISFIPWRSGYAATLGRNLPVDEVLSAVKAQGGSLNAFSLPKTDPLRQQIITLCGLALTDQGIGVIELQRDAQGHWQRNPSKADRRISGLSGLEDGRYLNATGPAIAVFENPQKLGYDDGLGSKIIGTFGNCAGGTTPWGTVLSAEENFQDQVPEAVYADGSAADPGLCPLELSEFSLAGQGNVFGLAGNKYGWMVEIDPTDPQDYGTKHSYLGRFRHEAVAIRAEPNQPLAVYSGCDRRSGHFYKFVSAGVVKNPKDKANSRLFADGTLYGAKFNPDGTGKWIALAPDTPINPILPSQIANVSPETAVVYLPNGDHQQAGASAVFEDQGVAAYQAQFKTLGDLYPVAGTLQQGAILVDAHYAANAIG
ncbi:MAG: PhoX family protein, partial [Synechocystis sp.]